MSAREIVREVAALHGLADSDIYGCCRRAALVRARDEAAFRIRREKGWSARRVGMLLQRDHTTVLIAIRRHEKRVGAP